MQWLNIELSVLENEAFGCADTAHLGAWLRLMRYCCIQENSGRIKGAKEWPDRKWMHLFRLTKAEIDQNTELWEWKDDELRVLFFPIVQLNKVKRLRSQSAKANETRWGKRPAKSDPVSIPSGMPDGKPNGNPDLENGTPECKGNSKGKSNSKGKGNSKGKAPGQSPDGSGQKPHSLLEALSYFSQQEAPESLARKFYAHYRANGWKQGGHTPIASWPDQADKWICDYREDLKKSSGGVAGGGEFDSRQPHAHTGGVEVSN